MKTGRSSTNKVDVQYIFDVWPAMPTSRPLTHNYCLQQCGGIDTQMCSTPFTKLHHANPTVTAVRLNSSFPIALCPAICSVFHRTISPPPFSRTQRKTDQIAVRYTIGLELTDREARGTHLGDRRPRSLRMERWNI